MCVISVIVPVYNTENYVEECIKSVLKQTSNSWELLLIDDGSTDKSGHICDEYASRDSRIKVIHKPNSGQFETRMAGIQIATGDYCTGLDSDDYLETDCIEKIINASEEEQYDIIAWNIRSVKEGRELEVSGSDRYGCYSRKEFLESVIKASNHSFCNKAIKTELLKRIDYSKIPTHLHDSEDYMLIVPPICIANSVWWMNETLYNYRQLTSGISNKLSPFRILEYFDSSMTVREYIDGYGMMTDRIKYYDNCVVMRLVVEVIKFIYRNGAMNRDEIEKIKTHPYYTDMKKNEHMRNLTIDQFFVLKMFRYGLYGVLSRYYSRCAK